ncbi:MAG: hypothetical protein IKQ73_07975 [Oscillospiraceae bacterium]|nr:hypothetical protein [Oscillospiraceae bacterium]MCR5173633.1 hypothetical protein [Oscillospiraceae bacterium]
MHKEKTNVAFGTRLLFIIVSLLISCFLWFTISVNEKQERTVDVSGIEIQYTGEDVLEENDLVVTNRNVDQLNLKLSGKQLTVARLNKDDITVTVDMSKIRTAGTHFLEYSIDYGSGTKASDVKVVNASVNYATVTVKKMVKTEIPVRGMFDGQIADGYMGGSIEFTPGTIEISGPEDEIAGISYAWVTLGGEDITQTLSSEQPFVLMDASNSEVASDNIKTSVNQITVVQEVLMLKEVPLMVNLINGAGADETNTIVDITPASLTLSGDPSIIESLNKIVLGTVDLTAFQTTYSETKPIVLPDNVSNKTGIGTAEVNVRIVGLDVTKLSVSNIEVINQPAGFDIELITQTVDITLRGPAEEISEVQAENVRIVADLSSVKSTGVFDVDANIFIDGYQHIGEIGSYKINVRSGTAESG